MRISTLLCALVVSLNALHPAGDNSLDFIVGEWDITNSAGKPTGTTKVEFQLPGAAISEVRRGTDGKELKLWYFFSETDRAWKSVFLGPNGAMRELVTVEKLPDGSVRMQGKFTNSTGPAAQSRFTYFKLADGNVRRLLETSDDDGQTWKTLVDATYRRRMAPTPK